jgi:hypothetical protein
MAAADPTETGAKGGKCAGGGGEAVRGSCHSRGPARSHQPLRMGWLPGWKTVTDVLSKTILQPWLAKGPRPIRVWGEDGMTWPDIVARGSVETKASMALATERSGPSFATVMPTVSQRGHCKKCRSQWSWSRQYPCAEEERLRGELELFWSIEHNNNFFTWINIFAMD